jgi:N-acylglucosamine-6-phosphate 2-epimerase
LSTLLGDRKGVASASLEERIRGGLIVSCQALPDEPMYSGQGGIMSRFAIAAERAGAKGIRANSVRDVREIRAQVGLPVIGIIKRQIASFEPFITPTIDEVRALVGVGADIVAFDCTMRERADGLTPGEFVTRIRAEFPDLPLMADISTLQEGLAAAEAGVDLIGTTLSGWTVQSKDSPSPNFGLVARLASLTPTPVIAEGGIRTPDQAKLMLEMGALSVVVGGAITRPLEIATEFVTALSGVGPRVAPPSFSGDV